jgi:hypothetical protein
MIEIIVYEFAVHAADGAMYPTQQETADVRLRLPSAKIGRIAPQQSIKSDTGGCINEGILYTSCT